MNTATDTTFPTAPDRRTMMAIGVVGAMPTVAVASVAMTVVHDIAIGVPDGWFAGLLATAIIAVPVCVVFGVPLGLVAGATMFAFARLRTSSRRRLAWLVAIVPAALATSIVAWQVDQIIRPFFEPEAAWPAYAVGYGLAFLIAAPAGAWFTARYEVIELTAQGLPVTVREPAPAVRGQALRGAVAGAVIGGVIAAGWLLLPRTGQWIDLLPVGVIAACSIGGALAGALYALLY
jgi:hypothetical protein